MLSCQTVVKMFSLHGICLAVIALNVFGTEWAYHEMSLWSVEYPDCGKDDESPINVQTNDVIVDDAVCSATFDWQIDFTQTSFAVTNNGHSLQLVAAMVDENGLQLRRDTNGTIAVFPDYFAPDGSVHEKYCLDSLHIHFGASSDLGSEHRIDNVSYPLEMHFVHFACDEGDISVATQSYANDSDPEVLAVVALFFELSTKNNSAFETILTADMLKNIEFPADEDDASYSSDSSVHVVDGLDLSALIPSTITTAGYYAYEGSLTTPPCTDIVRWHLMKATSSISESQLERLRTLKDEVGESMAPNYRDIQINVNNVWDCKTQQDETDSPASKPKLMRTICVLLMLLSFL